MPIKDDYYTDVDALDLTEGGIEPPTGNYKRYILPVNPDGTGPSKEYTRTSTIAGSMDDSYGLALWRLRRVVWAAAQRDDLMQTLRSIPLDDESKEWRSTVDEVITAAEVVAGNDSASAIGKSIHNVIQRVGMGERHDTIHPYFHNLIDNYLAALEREGLHILPEYIERVCRCMRYDIGGRFDNVYQDDKGRFIIGDTKTIGDPDDKPVTIAMQEAIYANSELLMDYTTNRYTAMPQVRRDIGLIVHVDRDTHAVIIERIDIEFGWACVRVAMEQRELRKRKHIIHPYNRGFGLAQAHGDPVVVPEVVRGSNGHVVDPQRAAEIAAATLAESHTRRGFDPAIAAAAEAKAAAATEPVPSQAKESEVATRPPPQPPATVGPTPNTAPPPRTGAAPAVDPQTRVDEIMAVRKNDKARLQQWVRALGGTDVAHNRKWLAEWIVSATPGSGAIEPDATMINPPDSNGGETTPTPLRTLSVHHPTTLAETGLPPAPPEPPGVAVVGPEVVDITPAAAIEVARNALSLNQLRVLWQRWEDTYGAGSWDTSGAVKEAADQRADFLRRSASGDDGPPF